MAVSLYLKRTIRGLEPADEQSLEALKLWKLGEEVRGDFVVPRKLERLKWWWKLCSIISDNSDQWASREAASDSLKMGIGIVESFQVKTPRDTWMQMQMPGSIAFNKMEEDAFREFCVKAQNYVCSDMLMTDYGALYQVLEDYLNTDKRSAA